MHDGWVSGPHHKQICDALERVERGETMRLLIETPPRHSKSELASKKFPAWFIGRNPRKQILTASYNSDLATDFGREVRNIVKDERYRKVFKNVDLAQDSTAAGRWHTSAGGVYIAAGVGGSITGRGAHLAIIDDPIKNRDEADSQRIRDNIWRWYTSTLLTRIMPGGSIVLIMTRWHDDDLAGRVLNTEPWERVKLRAIEHEGTDSESALWPDWYSLKDLQSKRDVMIKGGRARDWYALYQQNPTPEVGGYIDASWFDERHATVPRHNVYMASDFAVTNPAEGADPDYTEHGVFGLGAQKTYGLDWWSGQTTPDVWIDKLLDLAEKYKPWCWFGEAGVIRRAIEPFLVRRMRERKIFFRIEWIAPIHDKSVRGRAFQSLAAARRISFPREPWADRVIAQCADFGTGSARHDDAFDVMSLMCRCIDQAHPAIVIDDGMHLKKRDRYSGSSNAPDAWRVA